MNVHRKIARSWLHYSIAAITLVICSACSSPSEQIIGSWKTSFNCTSKKGVNVSYTGATFFSKNNLAEDRGSVTISSTDAQGKITKIGAKVSSTSNWYIENNKLTRGGYRSEFTISSVDRGSENLYSEKDISPYQINSVSSSSSCFSSYATGDSYSQKFCHGTADTEKQKLENSRFQARTAIATEATAELAQEAKKYASQELEIFKFDGEGMSLKQKNLEGLNDFHYTAVCEQQDFKKLTKEEELRQPTIILGSPN
jgi:hypothetical protein